MKLETFLRYIIFSYFFSLFIDDLPSKIPIPINGETCISGNAETYPGSKKESQRKLFYWNLCGLCL